MYIFVINNNILRFEYIFFPEKKKKKNNLLYILFPPSVRFPNQT